MLITAPIASPARESSIYMTYLLAMSNDEETNNLIVFCKTPRTRKEICDYLGLNSVTYAIQTYVNPLVEAGVIKLSIPDKPKSPKQLYYSVEREE